MKLPWQKAQQSSESSAAPADDNASESSASSKKLPKGYTPPKGRPTPKRADQEVARGVRRDPNALSAAQAGQRRKELKASMSSAEWKEYKRQEREESRKRNRHIQERMAAGDPRYLPERDKGEVKAFARDWVDSRRFINEWALPASLVFLLIFFLSSVAPRFANVATAIAMIFIVVIAVEGVWLGRRVNKAARQKFPNSTETGFSLGFYAYGRATQPKKWRTPRPRVTSNSR